MTMVYTNALIQETSPYLLQHAHNPVDWHPWGAAVIDKAKRESKLIIISIGYAACHWCHVMEHESFSDYDVADFMNQHFVCIKVDREERPDIDQIYMAAVQLINGSGGWPLNIIALPDTRPIYGGTYFPKQKWLGMLGQILEFVQQNPNKAEEQANALTKGINLDESQFSPSSQTDLSINDLHVAVETWLKRIDFQEGGYKRAPKFPLPNGYHFLLQFHHLTKNETALQAVTLSLDKMACGGIYDQVGGGFARYSTDSFWKVPHFEKMLYDNAQLVSLYSAAFQLTQKPLYKTIVEETLAFVERELTANKGGFFSSLDADSEGEEGKFYVWTKQEIQTILANNATLFIKYYNVKDMGNWEHDRNILFTTHPDNYFLETYHLSEEAFRARLSDCKAKLLLARSERIRPALDDKILTSWNALMLKSLVDAYRVFDNPDYLGSAIKHADFILENQMQSDYRLKRSFKHGSAKPAESASINSGFLDDYAFTIEAFISIYQATFEMKWLSLAKHLLKYATQHFHDEKTGMFFYTSALDPSLIARKMETMDNVIPSSNSVMAKNLFMLGMYFDEPDYIQKAKTMLLNLKEFTAKGGEYYGNWDALLAWFVKEPHLVAIVGDKCLETRSNLDKHFLPHALFLGETKPQEASLPLLKNKHIKGETMIYVCKNKTCQMPVTEAEMALEQLIR